MDGREYFNLVRECFRRIPGLQREYVALDSALNSCERSSTSCEVGRGGCGFHDETAQAFDDLEVTRRRLRDAADKYVSAATQCIRFNRLVNVLRIEHRNVIADAMNVWCRDQAATWSEIARELGCSRTTLTTKRNELYEQVSEGDYDRILNGEV